MRKWLTGAVGVAALVFGLACGAGTSSTSSGDGAPAAPGASTPGIVTIKVGETAHIKAFGGEYKATVSSLRTGQKGKYSKPEKGQFIAVDLKIEVIDGQQYASAHMLKLVLPSGEVFEPGYADVPGLDTSWSAQLNAGQNKGGAVIFDVPADLTGAKLYIQELDKPAAYWAL